MIDFLFICQWNIARSQIAEWLLKNIYSDKNINSCWIDDVWYKYNFKCYPPAIELMKERGIDITQQKPKVITKEMVLESKKIIIFCEENECNNKFPEYLKEHKNTLYIKIWDPNMKGDSFLKNTINEIEKIVKLL